MFLPHHIYDPPPIVTPLPVTPVMKQTAQRVHHEKSIQQPTAPRCGACSHLDAGLEAREFSPGRGAGGEGVLTWTRGWRRGSLGSPLSGGAA